MPRGGKRKGAGAPKGNTNALKHGGRARVLFGIPLDKELTRIEYRALCLEQLNHILEEDKNTGLGMSSKFWELNKRYKGAIGLRMCGMYYRNPIRLTLK